MGMRVKNESMRMRTIRTCKWEGIDVRDKEQWWMYEGTYRTGDGINESIGMGMN